MTKAESIMKRGGNGTVIHDFCSYSRGDQDRIFQYQLRRCCNENIEIIRFEPARHDFVLTDPKDIRFPILCPNF